MAGVNEERAARTYGGQTAAERAAGRRVVLLDAAFALVAESGWRALTIEAVCRAGGLNKRYFYDAFADLDALVGALVGRVAEDAVTPALAVLAAADPGAPVGETTRAVVRVLIAHLTDDPRRARVLFGAVPAGDAAAAHRSAAIRDVITTAAAQGRSIHHLAADDPVADVAASMLVGGTSQAVLDWLDGRIDAGRDAFVDDLVALWQAVGDTAAARARDRA